MAIEYEILPYLEWLYPARGMGALLFFGGIALVLIVLGVLCGFILTAIRKGPVEAFDSVSRVIANAVGDDLPNFSFRRTGAIARLAIQEAIRRRVVVVFLAFIVLLLFASWFLDARSDHPAHLYLGFVLTASTYLILLLTFFLSAFSLPTDIKNKTIYTVVTKPVRSGEILLGRVCGFVVVGTVLLLLVGISSYVFVHRGLAHQHEVDGGALVMSAASDTAEGKTSVIGTGFTSRDMHHRHEVTIYSDGTGVTDEAMGHRHSIQVQKNGDEVKYVVGPHEGMLLARVPQYGKLRFLDREGNPGKGISVGHEWAYRSYVEGQSRSAAIWSFQGLDEQDFPDGIPVEMTLRVFRTHKGNIEKGIPGELVIVSTNSSSEIRQTEGIPFAAVEFGTLEMVVPTKLKGVDRQGQIRDVDLFKDIVHKGQVEFQIRCKQDGQYLGMAQADFYIRKSDESFAYNFFKCFMGIWLQLLMATAMGVMFSAFLSAPVALLATISTIIMGFFGQFISGVMQGAFGVEVTGENLEEVVAGGGPIESLLRLLTQSNLTVEMNLPRFAEFGVKLIDRGLMIVMYLVSKMFPDFNRFNTSSYVAHGIDIPASLLAQQCTTAIVFSLVVSLIGYFILKTRELAA